MNTSGAFTPAVGLLIDGERRTHASGGGWSHVDPSTGREQAEVPMAGLQEVDEAVGAARRSSAVWRAVPPAERRRVLVRLAELIRKDVDALATMASMEMGGPITLTPYAVGWGADWIEDAAAWADRLYGESYPGSGRGVLEYSIPEPVGVVAALATWNGSTGALGMSIGAPLAAGCAVVAKPSELAPFHGLRIGELALEAGLPPGVLNVLTAGVDATAALVGHPGIDKVTFTGSPATARRIAAVAAANLTPCVLELGGKSASIVFDDADVSRAVAGAMQVTANAGQVCTLGSRILVHRDRSDEVVGRLVEACSTVKVGRPFDDAVTMGPVINEAAVTRVIGMLERAGAYGEVVTGGARMGGALSDGYFVEPTVVHLPDNANELAQDEVFGPVLAVIPFDEEDQAVAMANDSPYGLAGFVHTRDGARAHRVAAALDVGNVGINGGATPAGPHLAFGGRKQSGYGLQGGLAGVREFTNTKTVQQAL